MEYGRKGEIDKKFKVKREQINKFRVRLINSGKRG